MVLDTLSGSLRSALSKVASALFVDESVVKELVKELQKALILSDVNIKLVMELSQRIKERALKEEPPSGITKKEFLIRIVYEELVAIVGGSADALTFSEKPTVIMFVGLFGAGKTTTIGKVAKYYSKRGKRVAVVGLDTFRPAAMQQLEQLAKAIPVPVFVDKTATDPAALYRQFEPQLDEFDVVLVDTSGRDALNAELIAELRAVNDAVSPHHTWLVIAADVGQAAQRQAEAFRDNCSVNGVILTKLDGTAKGGGALTACAVTGSAIRFIGVGERDNDLEPFNPEGFIGRLLGMGDLSTLLDKIQGAVSQEDAKDLEKRLLKGQFTLVDLYEQMETMSKMGSFGKIMEMIPGLGSLKLPKDAIAVQEKKLETWKVAMNSMTKRELEEPDILSAERIDRVSAGSAISVRDVRELLKQYRQAKKMVKMLKGGNVSDPQQLMKKFGKQKMKFKRY